MSELAESLRSSEAWLQEGMAPNRTNLAGFCDNDTTQNPVSTERKPCHHPSPGDRQWEDVT